MNILNLAPFNVWDLGYGKGRVSTYLPLKGLADAGHRVWWLTSLDEVSEGDDSSLEGDGIKVVRFRVPSSTATTGARAAILSKLHSWAFLLSGFAKAYALTRHFRPDLICAHQLIAAFPAFCLSRLLGVPYTVKTYGFFGELFAQRLYWGKYAFRLPASLYILVNDGTSGDEIAHSFGVPDHRIAFLVNGIDKNLATKADQSLRQRLAPNGERIILSVYRLVPSKQIHMLIDAIPQIVSQRSDVRFVIVGDGPERARLMSLADRLGVSEYVQFEGSVPNEMVPSYLAGADLLVSLNSASSIANPVLEAMCYGTAVIALNTGTTSDLIVDGENGILLETDEIAELPRVVLEALDDDRRRGSLGKAARQFIIDNWPTWEERVAQEVQLLEGVVKSHRRARARKEPDA